MIGSWPSRPTAADGVEKMTPKHWAATEILCALCAPGRRLTRKRVEEAVRALLAAGWLCEELEAAAPARGRRRWRGDE